MHRAGIWFSVVYLGQHDSLASADFAVMSGRRLTINCDVRASVHLLRRWSNSTPLPGVAELSGPHTRTLSAVPRQQLSSALAQAPGAARCSMAHALPSRRSTGAARDG